MRKREMEMAVAFSALPFVRYTRTQPPAASPAPSISPTASCCCIARRTPGPAGRQDGGRQGHWASADTRSR